MADSRIDYGRPENVLELLEDRGCRVVNREAALDMIDVMLDVEGIGVYNADTDEDENGDPWEFAGGPRADQIQYALTAVGFISAD